MRKRKALETAEAVFTFGGAVRKLLTVLFKIVDINHSEGAHGAAVLCCPHCKRSYGTLPSYPVLVKTYSLVKCPCLRMHVGYKPFNGYM